MTLPEELLGLPWRTGRAGWEGGRVPDATPITAPVLLADLGTMVGSGMTGILSERGMEVVTAPVGADLAETVQRVRPSAVVLDLDGTAPRDLIAIVRSACPETKVVLWARREDVMEVLDPGATAPRFVLGSSPSELCAELVTTKPTSSPEDD